MKIRSVKWVLPLILLTACFSKRAAMTREGYTNIEVGMSVSEVRKAYGEPYKIYSKGDNEVTYEYIERIEMGSEVIEQRRYYIIISSGKVVGKYVKFSSPPPFQNPYSDDSYPN